jgi:hypothetical protein
VLKSKTSKIILVVLGVLVIAGIVWYILSRNKSAPSAPEQGQITASSKTAAGGGEFPTGGGTATTSPFSISPVASATATGPAVGYRLPGNTAISNSNSQVNKRELAQGVVEYQPSITPYPGSGDLDWTRNPPKIIDVSGSPYSKMTFCQIAGLSDSWAKPIEKFACDSLNFFSDKIIEPLSALNCMLAGASLQANYDQKITWEYENGQCKILDR